MNTLSKPDNIQILCVDDEQNILDSLQRTLGRYFNIHTALNGKEALKKLAQNSFFPVIITDYSMPDMNGLELLKRVHKVSPNTIMIMLTGTAELEVAIHTINESNIFRFLAKPCKTDILHRTINEAIEHYHLLETQQRLTAQLAASHAKLTQQKQELEYQLSFAQTIFSKIIARNENTLPELDIYMSPMERVGGDIILSYLHPNDTLYIMLGDVTGHGLPAAIASLLISDTFVALSTNHGDIETIAESINQKICQSLPTGLFCAAILVQFNYHTQTLAIWQGGLPDAYLLNKQGIAIETVHSKNLALGILADQNFSDTASYYSNTEISSLFACSDGLTEQTNPDHEMFGEQRVLDHLQHTPAHLKRVVHLTEKLEQFRANSPQSDDLSLFELNIAKLRQNITSFK